MRKDIFVMTMLVFCIAFVFLSSVSAADDNSAIGTLDNISQDASPMIDEVNSVNVDDAIPVGDNVVNIGNNKLDKDLSKSGDSEKDCTKLLVYIDLDCNYGVENSTVKITPTVRDGKCAGANVITGGTLNIYSDYHKTNLIASIDLDNESSFDYKVPECAGSVSSNCIPIFYNYEKYDAENNILYYDSSSLKFYSMNTNNFTISVRDSEGRESQNDTIVIDEGEPLFLNIDHLDYKLGSSHIIVKVDGVDNNQSFVQQFNFDFATHKILFDDATLPIGEYVISAICEENVVDDFYYAGAESNKISVKVLQEVDFFDIFNGIVDAIQNIEVPA